MGALARLAKGLPLLLLSPALILLPWLAFLLEDLIFLFIGRRRPRADKRPSTKAASVVIPNWNGRDLLEKYLPSVATALAANPENEIIVVDNGSTDGSAEFVRSRFPQVRVLPLPRNLGFGGGSNAGFRAAKNDIVVLLNSDMRVDPGFLPPLLEAFSGERVFAVSCQIFFTDPGKTREESGLTQAWWDKGRLGVRHRIDDRIREPFPCFYPGGGSSAFDRRKFLELGAFDHLMAPFYLEDTDLGYQAWKRGWIVYYQPASIVWHEHRGTIGKKFSQPYIESIIQKNFLLFAWKNIHEWPRLTMHFLRTWADALFSYCGGHSRERANFAGLARAFLQLPQALVSRWRALTLARLSDTDAFRLPLGGYFHDRFHALPAEPQTLGVLMLSPYPIYPPVHGGGVFMYGAASALGRLVRLHVVAVLDEEWQIEQHDPLTRICASAEFLIRPDSHAFGFGAISPHAVREFQNADLEWIIHRQIYLHRIDVLQIEYTNMGQYAGDYRRILTALFEHDVYFQSIGRGLSQPGSLFRRTAALCEYLRALRFELQLLPRMDQVQVCSKENKDYLLSFLPDIAARVDETLRAGIDTSRYQMHLGPREPYTMLFLGSFRHIPNQEALDWFAKQVLPRVVERCPDSRLVIVGSDPPPRHSLPAKDRNVEIRGFVEDLHEPFSRYAVFVCPILSGSGVRVKLLEAFCTGIPVVSTTLGAEGLSERDRDLCHLADDPAEFAERILHLFENRSETQAMIERARAYVTTERDIGTMATRLVLRYREGIRAKRSMS
jgi:GT2 family glycosyltransferase/glycosyltransferase involved in cell wall biosynthesis